MTGWQWAVGLVLLVHGVGHVLGLFPVFRVDLPSGWSARSWLITDTIGETASKRISAVLWSICTILFVVAGLAVLGWGIPYEWWRPLAVVGAGLSTVTLVLFWNGFPALFPNKIGALAVNFIILGGVLIGDWPTDEMLGH